MLIGNGLWRWPPAYDPQIPWTYCQEIDVEGFGEFTSVAPSGLNVLLGSSTYAEGAILNCTYRSLSADQLDTTAGGGPGGTPGAPQQSQQTAQEEIELATMTGDASAQNLTLQKSKYRWDLAHPDKGSEETLESSGTEAVKTIPRIEFSLTRHFVIRVPMTAISALLGKINASLWGANHSKSGSLGWPAETIRLDGASWSRKVTNTGAKFYDVTYKFSVQPVYDKIETGAYDWVGWNRLYREDTDRWEKVSTVRSGGRIHRLDTVVSLTLNGTTVSGLNLLFHPYAY